MKLFIVAGEASGDQLGARLLADLRKLNPSMEVRGIGGAAMATEGMASIFPMQELSLMGLAEVLPKISNIVRRLNNTVKAVYEFCGVSPQHKMSPRPRAGVCLDVCAVLQNVCLLNRRPRDKPGVTDLEGGEIVTIVTIDAPDFCKRLARRLQPLRRAGRVKLIHYVAPTVWAWRPGRAKKMAELFDHLLCLFPFEPPYFEKVGLPATFVGHPITTSPALAAASADRLRAKLGIRPDQPVLCLLPGSRAGEVQRLLPVFLETFARLKIQQPDLIGLLPTLPTLGLDAHEGIFVLTDPQDKWDAFALAASEGSGAIAASGTVTLELAAAGVPHLVAYKMHAMTYWIARALVKLPFVNLVNILAGKEIVTEILQGDVTAENLAREYQSVLQNAAAQKTAMTEQLEKLRAAVPDAAAQILIRITSRLP